MNDLIKKLKDKDYVRAFGLMTSEEQECLKSMPDETLVCLQDWLPIRWDLIQHIDWTQTCNLSSNTFAIKSNYQPESESELNEGLYEELKSISIAADLGNLIEPVWDGTVTGKPNQHILKKMGLIECCHGYYFPTTKGIKVKKEYRSKFPKLESDTCQYCGAARVVRSSGKWQFHCECYDPDKRPKLEQKIVDIKITEQIGHLNNLVCTELLGCEVNIKGQKYFVKISDLKSLPKFKEFYIKDNNIIARFRV